MRRRQYLATALCGAATLAGCTGRPTPSASEQIELPADATDLSFKYRRVDEQRNKPILPESSSAHALALVTAPAGLEVIDQERFDSADRAFLTETDFSAAFVLGVEFQTGNEDSDIEVARVAQTPDRMLHVFSHIGLIGGEDAAMRVSFLVRVQREDLPEPTIARHSVLDGNDAYERETTATPATRTEQ